MIIKDAPIGSVVKVRSGIARVILRNKEVNSVLVGWRDAENTADHWGDMNPWDVHDRSYFNSSNEYDEMKASGCKWGYWIYEDMSCVIVGGQPHPTNKTLQKMAKVIASDELEAEHRKELAFFAGVRPGECSCRILRSQCVYHR